MRTDSSPCTAPARILRRVDMAECKDIWSVRYCEDVRIFSHLEIDDVDLVKETFYRKLMTGNSCCLTEHNGGNVRFMALRGRYLPDWFFFILSNFFYLKPSFRIFQMLMQSLFSSKVSRNCHALAVC